MNNLKKIFIEWISWFAIVLIYYSIVSLFMLAMLIIIGNIKI